MPKKPTKPEPPARPKPTLSYPSAPTDPAERRDHMRRRNARIANVDEEIYLAAIKAQDERALRHGAEPRPDKRT